MAPRKRDQGRRRDVQGAAQRYGKAHRRKRAQWAVKVDAGHVNCWRCGKWIQPGTPWHLGHDDRDPTLHRGPEHERCNVTAAVRKLNQLNRKQQTTTSRQW